MPGKKPVLQLAATAAAIVIGVLILRHSGQSVIGGHSATAWADDSPPPPTVAPPESLSPGTWERVLSEDIHQMHFCNARTGAVIGMGTLAVTSDGGKTWNRPANRMSFSPHDVFVLDEKTIYLCRDGVLKSEDAGARFASAGLEGGPSVGSIRFLDINTGFAVKGGEVFRTSDGGKTWKSTVKGDFSDICFVNSRLGFAFGGNTFGGPEPGSNQSRGSVARTSDGGETWVSLDFPFPQILGASFPSAQAGYAITIEGQILKTADGGEKWQKMPVAASGVGLHGLDFLDANEGYAVGDGGAILHTRDGGTTWERESSGTTKRALVVQCPDSSTTYVLVDDGLLRKVSPPSPVVK